MKNRLITAKSASIILGRSKSLMRTTKRILESSRNELMKAKVDPKLTAHKDITIIGNLMWEKETQDEMNWYDAMKYAGDLKLGGCDDWRLPTVEELRGIMALCGGEWPILDDDDYEDRRDRNWKNKSYQASYKEKGFLSYFYWSSTTIEIDTEHDALSVSFHDGDNLRYGKYSIRYVRCVRTI